MSGWMRWPITLRRSATGRSDTGKYEKYWPADVQMIGKEIVRFHCVYWPALLMAAGLPVPQKIMAHGWLLFEESKMSKSRGNIVRTETILDVLGQRRAALFSAARNCVRAGRVVFLRRPGAALQRRSGQRPGQPGQPYADHDHALFQGRGAVSLARRDRAPTRAPSPTLHARRSLNSMRCSTNTSFRGRWKWRGAWSRRSTSTSSRISPGRWARKQDDESRARLATILYTSAEALRIVTALAHPVIPEATAKIWAQLGLGDIRKFSLVGIEVGTAPAGDEAGRNTAGLSARRQERNRKDAADGRAGTQLLPRS